MSKVGQEELWFNTPDSNTLCRGGGNGPNHPSQLYAIKKYVKPGMSLLDFGCGSATTYEAITNAGLDIDYTGTDVIKKNIDWCQETYPEGKFVYNGEVNTITQPDKSFDVAFSRHVVDHMSSFEQGLDEHCRVARKLVIIVLWYSLNDREEHDFKNIIDGPQDDRQTYQHEYLNSYSRDMVKEYIASKKDWKLVEFTEGIHNLEEKGAANQDICIVLERNEKAT